MKEKDLQTKCSYCGKSELPNGKWGFYFPRFPKSISHGVCPVCFDKAMKEIEKV